MQEVIVEPDRSNAGRRRLARPYRNQWQFRPENVPGAGGTDRPENDDEFESRIRATFREQLAAAKASGVLVPQVGHGYWPANGDGDEFVVWTPRVPVHQGGPVLVPNRNDPFLCITDFFRPICNGELALHLLPHGHHGLGDQRGDRPAVRR